MGGIPNPQYCSAQLKVVYTRLFNSANI
jgi:hypothetical protein